MDCIQAISQKKICDRCGKLRINCVCFLENKQTGKLQPKDINLYEMLKKNKENKSK